MHFLRCLLACFVLLVSDVALSGETQGAEETTKVATQQTLTQKLINFVSHTVENMKYSAYKFGGNHFDPHKGVYILDCSAYVDNILETVHPDAYFDLAETMGTEKPTSHDYYAFFKQLPQTNMDTWSKVDAVSDLKAGDVLVFRYKNRKSRITGGHVMVVMDAPVGDDDSYYTVKVADSAHTKHSEDTRQHRESGVGIGILSLKAHPETGRPYAYAWREGSKWVKNVNFAMARPVSAKS